MSALSPALREAAERVVGTAKSRGHSVATVESCTAGALAGRIVFVGVSALGLGDTVATPLGTFLPGVEVHATVADNLLLGDFVRRPPGATVMELALVLLAAVGVGLGVAGVAYLDTASKQFVALALNSGKTDGMIVVGSKL